MIKVTSFNGILVVLAEGNDVSKVLEAVENRQRRFDHTGTDSHYDFIDYDRTETNGLTVTEEEV